MKGKVKKEYHIECDRTELETIYEAIVLTMKSISECNPIMDIYEQLKNDISYILEE